MGRSSPGGLVCLAFHLILHRARRASRWCDQRCLGRDRHPPGRPGFEQAGFGSWGFLGQPNQRVVLFPAPTRQSGGPSTREPASSPTTDAHGFERWTGFVVVLPHGAFRRGAVVGLPRLPPVQGGDRPRGDLRLAEARGHTGRFRFRRLRDRRVDRLRGGRLFLVGTPARLRASSLASSFPRVGSADAVAGLLAGAPLHA